MFAGEHPVLSVRAEPLQVIPEQLNELGRTRYRAALLGVSPLDDSCFSVARRADLGTSGVEITEGRSPRSGRWDRQPLRAAGRW